MTNNDTKTEPTESIPIRLWIIFFVYSLGFPAIIFLSAGTIRWPMGWWYYGLAVAATLLSRLIAAFVHPDMLRERGRSLDAVNTEGWDRILSPMVGLILPVVVILIIGLDHRWSWSPKLPSWVAPVSIVVVVLGYAFSTWAFLVNRFFSGVVRIQAEREHTVVTDGPYRFIRHPGYLGGLVAMAATSFMLGSLWGLIPVALYAGVLVLRTALEDRMLQEELPGYREYAQRTRYRLLPGIW
jgi:protein-S-isoprenylcysteine O-methyltransferase Ste14